MTTLTDLPLDVLGSIMDIRVKATNAAAVTLQKVWRGAIQRLQWSAGLVRMVRRDLSLWQWALGSGEYSSGSFASGWRSEMNRALKSEGIRPIVRTSDLFDIYSMVRATGSSLRRLRQEYTPRQRASIFWDAL